MAADEPPAPVAGPAATLPAEAVPPTRAGTGRRVGRREVAFGAVLLAPALVLLGALVAYPIVFTVVRSLFGRVGDDFVGLENYRTMADRDSARTAIWNNIIWVIVAPVLVTFVGLVFAVLAERVRLGTAFKIIVFMPMAISFLAAGVIFRLVYDQNPDIGLANAAVTAVHDLFTEPGQYQRARPSVPEALVAERGAFATPAPVPAGSSVALGVIALRPEQVPENAKTAVAAPPAAPDAVTGTVWLDFSVERGVRGVPDAAERGLPGMEVRAVDASGHVVDKATADDEGTFTLDGLEPGQSYRIELAASNFKAPWTGWIWLGDTDVTPIGPAVVTVSVIVAYLWIWAGFSMVVIAAGLASIPRETQEAARVDGAGEWQVFRRVTVPLLWPVVLVVLVTLTINVLKIFDLVLIIPPGSSQDDANVIALELWRVSFGGAQDQGLGSALAVLLFVLVIPFMALNIRRFRLEER
jgi:alpha-glucoside transport system permease protein